MKNNEVIEKKIEEYLTTKSDGNKKEAVIITAYKPDDKEIDNLLRYLPILKKFTLSWTLKLEIIAGFVIQIGSLTVDLSFRSQLKDLYRNLYENL